jgi:hypothetical protein
LNTTINVNVCGKLRSMRRVLPIRKLAHANVAVAYLRTPELAPLDLSLEGGGGGAPRYR